MWDSDMTKIFLLLICNKLIRKLDSWKIDILTSSQARNKFRLRKFDTDLNSIEKNQGLSQAKVNHL